MANLYAPVRLVTMILSMVLLIIGIVRLIEVVQASVRDTTILVTLCIMIGALFVGFYGSYYHDQNYLYTYALIMFIGFIVGFFGNKIYFEATVPSILLIVLSVFQAEMLRRGIR